MDPAVPAGQFLVGPQAINVVRVPVEAAGGRIESLRVDNVQYRPGTDVVVRYTAKVSWNGKPARRDTLAAVSTLHGASRGTVPVSATMADGTKLEVGVWRWPFDPVLVGLAEAVTPTTAAELIGATGSAPCRIDVLTYRPTDRVVVRVTSGDLTRYIKVVAPATALPIAERHDQLRRVGVPAPEVVHVDETGGLIVMEELAGTTWRELIKGVDGRWPDAAELDQLADAFSRAEMDGEPAPCSLIDGALHARMLGVVMPRLSDRFGEVAATFESANRESGAPVTVHGDLHEAQLVVCDGTVVGVLDVDDAGPGLAIDDRANVIARLRFRAITNAAIAPKVAAAADSIRHDSRDRFDLEQLDLYTAAALVGLATGPFRVQSADWRAETERLLDAVAGLFNPDEKTLSSTSSPSHDSMPMMAPTNI